MIKNQKGNAIILGLILMTLLSGLLLLTIIKLRSDHIALIEKTRVYLCAKKHKKIAENYMKKMDTMNTIIKIADKGKYAVLIPGGAPAAKISKQTKEATQYAQNLYNAKKSAEIFKITHKECKSLPSLRFTPYKTKKAIPGLLSRSPVDGSAILRKKTWTTLFHYGNTWLKIDYSISKNNRRITTEVKEYSSKTAKELLKSFFL